MERYISIEAHGNPDAHSGYQPVVWFGSPNFSVKQDDYTGFADNSYFFVVRIEQNKVVYTIVKNNVRSHEALRNGVSLKIAMSVPNGYGFADGKTPYDVLLALKDEFLKRCMTLKDSATETYEYNAERLDHTSLDEVAKRFPLVEHPSACRPMTGTGIAYCMLNELQTMDFFRDVQYPEFAQYSEIVIAEKVDNTPYTPLNIITPRPANYALFVNGQFKCTVTDVNTPLHFHTQANPQFYDNQNVDFTISDLRNGNFVNGVAFDPITERIDVMLNALPATRNYYLNMQPAEAVSSVAQLQLSLMGRPIPLRQDLSFTLTGEDNGKVQMLQLTDRSGRFTMQSITGMQYDELKKAMRVDVSIKKVAMATGSNTAAHATVCPLTFINDLGGRRISFCESTFTNIKMPSRRLVQIVRFTQQGGQQGIINIPRDWVGQQVTLNVNIDGKAYEYPSALPLRENMALRLSALKPTSKGMGWLKIAIASTAGLLVVGLIIGAVLYFTGGNEPSIAQTGNAEGDSIQNSVKAPEMPQMMTKEQRQAFVDTAMVILDKNADIQFAEVDSLYALYVANDSLKPDVDSLKDGQKLALRLEGYKRVVDAVKAGDMTEMKKIANDSPENLHIWGTHLEAVQRIFGVGMTPKPSNEALTMRQKYVASHRIKSFKELRDVENIVENGTRGATNENAAPTPANANSQADNAAAQRNAQQQNQRATQSNNQQQRGAQGSNQQQGQRATQGSNQQQGQRATQGSNQQQGQHNTQQRNNQTDHSANPEFD
ncbi:MAG: hypothetical protein KBT39_09900 [Bacteroidales bacterium]|nr:hypothetical protein [Bacteroidales bacterium]